MTYCQLTVTYRNKFCFTGGLFEASVQLPGTNNVVGMWPAIWTMGNLGRAGYGATLEGMVSSLVLAIPISQPETLVNSSGHIPTTRATLARRPIKHSMVYPLLPLSTETHTTTTGYPFSRGKSYRDAHVQARIIQGPNIRMGHLSDGLRPRLIC